MPQTMTALKSEIATLAQLEGECVRKGLSSAFIVYRRMRNAREAQLSTLVEGAQ